MPGGNLIYGPNPQGLAAKGSSRTQKVLAGFDLEFNAFGPGRHDGALLILIDKERKIEAGFVIEFYGRVLTGMLNALGRCHLDQHWVCCDHDDAKHDVAKYSFRRLINHMFLNRSHIGVSSGRNVTLNFLHGTFYADPCNRTYGSTTLYVRASDMPSGAEWKAPFLLCLASAGRIVYVMNRWNLHAHCDIFAPVQRNGWRA